MEKEAVLGEPEPKFLNGIEPGSIGGQRQKLDRQVIVLGTRRGLRRPIGRRAKVSRSGLGHEANKHVRVKVDRPVIQRQINDLRLGVSLGEEGIKIAETWQSNLAVLPGGDLSRDGVERGDDASSGVRLMTERGKRLMTTPLGISPRYHRLSVEGELIQVQKHMLLRLVLTPKTADVNPVAFRLIARIRAV